MLPSMQKTLLHICNPNEISGAQGVSTRDISFLCINMISACFILAAIMHAVILCVCMVSKNVDFGIMFKNILTISEFVERISTGECLARGVREFAIQAGGLANDSVP